MIMRRLFYTFALCSLIASSLCAMETQEDISSPYPLPSHKNPEPKKNFPFVSIEAFTAPKSRMYPLYKKVSIPLPGIGRSLRKNRNMTDISIHSIGIFNILSYSKSKIIYNDSCDHGIYFSYGIGGYLGNIKDAPILGLIIPVHAGYEGEKGFIDLGGEVEPLYIVGPFLMPQIRAGLKF